MATLVSQEKTLLVSRVRKQKRVKSQKTKQNKTKQVNAPKHKLLIYLRQRVNCLLLEVSLFKSCVIVVEVILMTSHECQLVLWFWFDSSQSL